MYLCSKLYVRSILEAWLPYRSRFHLCFWLFSGTIGQFSEASVLECTQQLWRPGSRSTHPSWRQFSKNNCIILTIFVQRPEISSFQKQRKIQNRPFCYICTMFSIWRFPKKKLRMTWPPTHLAISALCGGNVVTWWPLTKPFPFEIHFTQVQEYFLLPRKRIQTFSSFSTWFVWKRIQEFVLKNANNVSCPLLFLPFPLNWANTNFQFQIQRWNIWRIFFGLMFIVGYLGRCGWNACVQKGQLTVNCD